MKKQFLQTTLILTQHDVERLVDVRAAIGVVREAFKAQARGETGMPSKIYLPLANGGDFRAMPAALKTACGIKWVNVHPQNLKRGLPTVMAIIIINDPATGLPLAIMDGTLVTKLRTAAAAAVAAKTLARPNSRIVGMVGCGAQAESQLLALASLFRLKRVNVWGFGKGESAQFCKRMGRVFPNILFESCLMIPKCVEGSDIVVTLTPSRRPLVKCEWISAGTHINAIGADGPGKQELDPEILRQARVVVDEREQAIHGGELNVPVRLGQFDPKKIHAELGQVLLGRASGRRSAREITVFDSTGLAIHDIALGAEIVRLARQRRVGRRITLF